MDHEWQMQHEAAIEHFMNFVGPPMQEKLDYTPVSLLYVGEWLLDRYPSPESVLDENDAELLKGVEYYVGEAYRRNLGGRWNLHPSPFEPDNPDRPYEVIDGFNKDDLTEAIIPAFRIMETLREGIEPYLSQDLEGLVHYYRRKYSQ